MKQDNDFSASNGAQGGIRCLHSVLRYGQIATLSVLLAACASIDSKDQQPDWVNGAAADYPAGQYLLGRGSAASVDLAQERARADLAKVFEVAVTAEGSDRQSSRRDGEATRYEESSERRVVTRTDKVIQGVKIAALWKAPAAARGEQHALAVLPRAQAAMGLRSEIEGLDQAIASELDKARQAPDALSRAAYAGRAVSRAKERAALDKTLRVLDLGGRGLDAAIPLARLESDFEAQLKNVVLLPRLITRASVEEAQRLMPVLSGALTHAGFAPAVAKSDEAAVKTDTDKTDASSATETYTLTFKPNTDTQRIDGWYWVRGNLEITIMDMAGKLRGSKVWPIKVSAQEASAVEARAVIAIDTLLKRELRDAILDLMVQ